MPFAFLLTSSAFVLRAATVCVWQNSPSPAAPFSDWLTAAHTIQEGVDLASAGDEVLVLNGVYDSGGRAVDGLMTNRVAIDKPITVLSVNGPAATVIVGARAPAGGAGDGAIRCVYLADGANLSGFTLINGATRAVYDPPAYAQSGGGGVWCASGNAVVSNCALGSNAAAYFGGGAYGGTLSDCTLTDNSAAYGGGASAGALNDCTLTNNTAAYLGGGAYGSVMSNCVLSGNSANEGGGAYESALNNCTLTGNSAFADGGGAGGGTLNNCALTGNSAGYYGGGVSGGTLNNCTLAGNSAGYLGGGAYYGTFNNCIVYFNTAADDPNQSSSEMNFCCTIPAPDSGFGNITNNPAFASPAARDFHLLFGSPCIDAGTNLSAIITNDLNGHARPLDGNGDGVAAFDIGAYEFVPPACYVWQDSPVASPPYNTWSTAAHTIQDAVNAASAGDIVLVTNGVYDAGGSGQNRVAISNALVVQSVNGPAVTVIQGAFGAADGTGATRCAYLLDGAVLSGFTLANGHTHYGSQGGAGVWMEAGASVTNCILTANSAYEEDDGGGGAKGGALYDCIVTNNLGDLGGGTYGSVLFNCLVISNGATFGGGAYGGVLFNCGVIGNRADSGGGVFWGTVHNCTVSGNSVYVAGGGTWGSTLDNCTVANNLAEGAYDWEGGGGVFGGTLNNCIVYFNSALHYPNCDPSGILKFCCTTPLPAAGGLGNIANDPAFVNGAAGDFHLQTSSPCVNSGDNTYVTTATDLDNNPRIVRGTVDIGAYEYQGVGSIISYAWLQQYGLPTDGSVDVADLDGDQMNTWQEWMADTNPTNAASCLCLSILPNPAPVAVTFSSSAARLYTLLRSTTLAASPPSSGWTPVPGQTDIPGNDDALTLTDTNPPTPAFYRVSARFP